MLTIITKDRYSKTFNSFLNLMKFSIYIFILILNITSVWILANLLFLTLCVYLTLFINL